MKKYRFLALSIFVLSLFCVAFSVQAQEEKKPVLVVKGNCVEGLVMKFEDRAENFGEEAAFDAPIAQFKEEDYEIADPQELAGISRDLFGYPRACTIFDQMREEQAKADTAQQDTIKSSGPSADPTMPEENK